ncbi:energy-coupling factor transporter transmembrane component T, partial [Paenibacillus validus]|uniref:energy-coupling factor transporter transmembrane component T n=1 Tax=Paenibacillus validus TaxID=44253 RepID=UPI002E240D4E|nr:energy-coupling factor transporter transmembrane component T [Paenibacillus validus]
AQAPPAGTAGDTLAPTRLSAESAPSSIGYRLDPRSKWLLYVLLVIGTMMQQHWTGLTVALIPVLLGFAGLPRPVWAGLLKFARLLLLFFAISVTLAGVTLTTGDGFPRIGFSQAQAMTTGFNVFRLFVVTLASLWFAVTTPYGRMVEGLNWALAYGKKAKLPVDSFALAVSLIFRFIPMILNEWQRFSDIVRARGKAPLQPGTVRPRDIPALIVPLLLSLFHRAENMTIAMEMKKIGRRPLVSSRSRLLVWTRADRLAVVFGLVWLAVLIALRK